MRTLFPYTTLFRSPRGFFGFSPEGAPLPLLSGVGMAFGVGMPPLRPDLPPTETSARVNLATSSTTISDPGFLLDVVELRCGR